MKIKEMIEVMQAFDDGKAIQISQHSYPDVWLNDGCPGFNWYACDYRVKPEEPATLKARIKAEFPVNRVVLLVFMLEGDDKRESLKITSDDYSYECQSGIYHEDHLSAQGMKGFYKYVYEVEGGELFPQRSPTTGHGIGQETIMPVAVLFEDDK